MNETKKIIAVLLLLAICLAILPSCGKSDLKIDGMEFEFAYVRAGDEMAVRACGSAYAEKYEGAQVLDYTLKAEGKKLTITGKNGTYEGEYKLSERYEASVLYEITVGSEEGHASLSEKILDDGTAEYTLILSIRGYNVVFTAKKTSE